MNRGLDEIRRYPSRRAPYISYVKSEESKPHIARDEASDAVTLCPCLACRYLPCTPMRLGSRRLACLVLIITAERQSLILTSLRLIPFAISYTEDSSEVCDSLDRYLNGGVGVVGSMSYRR